MSARSVLQFCSVFCLLTLFLPLQKTALAERSGSSMGVFEAPFARNHALPDSRALRDHLLNTAQRIGSRGPNDVLGPLGIAAWPLRSPPVELLASVQYASFVRRGLTLGGAVRELTEQVRKWGELFRGEVQCLVFYVYLGEDKPGGEFVLPSDLVERVTLSHRGRSYHPRSIGRLPGLFEIVTGQSDSFGGTRLNREHNQLLLIHDFTTTPIPHASGEDSSLILSHRLPSGISKIRLLWPPARNLPEPPEMLRVLSGAVRARVRGRPVRYSGEESP